MSLIDLAFVKQYFPQWDKYCIDEDTREATDAILQNQIDLAEDEYLEYVAATADNLTASMKRHLLIFTKKYCFGRLHDDEEFEHRPRILVDYDNLVSRLKDFKGGMSSLTGDDPAGGSSFIINSKDRKFDEWFGPDVNDLTSAENQ